MVLGEERMEEVVREAAARAADHRAVAVGLGGLQKAHWEGRKAPAARVVEASGGASLGRSSRGTVPSLKYARPQCGMCLVRELVRNSWHMRPEGGTELANMLAK